MRNPAIPPAVQTLFADLVQQVSTAPPAGSVYRRTRDGREYIYAKLSVGNARIDSYIGNANDPQAVAQAELMQTGMALAADRRRIVAMLRRHGLAAPDRVLGATLDALSQAGLFREGAVLIGTAAYLVSEPLVGSRLPAATLMTGDLDLATASLALSADPPARMEDILKRADPSFTAVVQLDPRKPPSHFRTGQGYLVDLVTPKLRRHDANPMPLTALGAGAAPLQHLAWLIEEPVETVALWGAGIPVSVPQPARFAIHKLIVAQRRYGSDRLKRGKDLSQARALIQVLLQYDRFALADALTDARAQGKEGWEGPIERSLTELGLLDAL